MKKYSNETIVGIFVVLGLVAIGYMAVRIGNISIAGDNTYSLYAPFSTVSGLRVGNSIEMVGIEIGRVAAFKMDQEKQQAIVELRINKGIEVFDDAIASIKTAGLIGDKYIEIDPGGGGDQLGDGDTIFETESPVDIMELVSKYAFGDVEK
jgi:phospholipid/cholesterol/gamma-HCH transport system substrate-binding protein